MKKRPSWYSFTESCLIWCLACGPVQGLTLPQQAQTTVWLYTSQKCWRSKSLVGTSVVQHIAYFPSHYEAPDSVRIWIIDLVGVVLHIGAVAVKSCSAELYQVTGNKFLRRRILLIACVSHYFPITYIGIDKPPEQNEPSSTLILRFYDLDLVDAYSFSQAQVRRSGLFVAMLLFDVDDLTHKSTAFSRGHRPSWRARKHGKIWSMRRSSFKRLGSEPGIVIWPLV